MTDKIDFPRVIASLDSDITSLTYYLDRVMKTSSDDISSHILGIMAQNVKLSLMYVLISGHPLHPVLGSSTLEQIRRVISILDGWYGVVILGTPGNAERFKHNLEKSVSLLVTMFRNRLTELTLMNEEKDLALRLSEKQPVEAPAEDIKVSDFYNRVQTAQYVRVPKVFDDVDYWWRITDSKKQPNGVIIGLTRTTQEGENKFCEHFVHVSDFDRMVLSERDPAKTEVDLCPKKDIETRLRENKWVWVLDKDSSESGKWWAIDRIRTGDGQSRSKELLLSRVTDLDGSKLKISIDFNRFDLSKLKLSARPTLVETHRIVASMISAKYIKMFGEGEWMYVEGVNVTEMPDHYGNNFVKFGIVTMQGIRSSIDTTDVALYYSNTLMSVDKSEQLEIAEGERLRDFLDKAGSNRYVTITQAVDGQPMSITYVIEGFVQDRTEPGKSLVQLSLWDKVGPCEITGHTADSLVLDKFSTYSFSNEPPSV